jgi:hypothetical protein
MSIGKRLGVAALAAVLGIGALEVGALFGMPGIGFVREAEAIVGRPLTPVSVAGVTRRTVRRCAAGVYRC